MRTILIIAVACIVAQSSFATPTKSGTTHCTDATNPWGSARCSNSNCQIYTDSSTTAPIPTYTGYSCSSANTGYTLFTAATIGTATGYGSDNSGNSSDFVCVNTCGTPSDNTVSPCDASGSLCAVCASGYNTSGKAPNSTAPQPCNCKLNASANTTTCTSCAHGYYGVDNTSTALNYSDVGGSGDTSYLNYATTNAAKCVACPTTLTNCAQCSSNVTCAKCSAASGNTPDSSGSCSAAKVFASIALVLVGMVALLF